MTNGKMEEGEEKNMDDDEEEEEEVAITDIDDPQPIFTQPLATIPGQLHSIVLFQPHRPVCIVLYRRMGCNYIRVV